MSARQKVRSLLRTADIEIGGERPWDIEVRDERLYQRVLGEGTLGAGEAYMDGWWDAEQLDDVLRPAASGAYRPCFARRRCCSRCC